MGQERGRSGDIPKANPVTELRCTRDLALRLGAIGPETIAHHRELKHAGHMLVRDTETSWPMFWPWELSRADMATAKSS
jgi:hypothetical protein